MNESLYALAWMIIGFVAASAALWGLFLNWRRGFRSILGAYAAFTGQFLVIIAAIINIYRDRPIIAQVLAILAFMLFGAFLSKAWHYHRKSSGHSTNERIGH
jgi:hydrogenase-4 membrane subunit HyfE